MSEDFVIALYSLYLLSMLIPITLTALPCPCEPAPCSLFTVIILIIILPTPQLVEETNRNVQLTLAVQSLQGRLTAMERSANALRELLRQKLGDQGVLHLMAALEQLGAGSNALLEVPATSASTALTGEGDGGGDANNSGRGGGGRDVEQSNGFYPGNRVRIADDRISVSAPLGSARNSESGRSGNISRNQRMDLLHSAEERDEDGSRGSSTAESKAYSRGGIHRSDGRRKDSYAKAIDGAIYR